MGLTFGLAMALSSIAVGCGPDWEGEGAPLVEAVADSTPLYVASTKVWPVGAIPVCWENPAATNATERGWVRDAVERTWQAESAAT